MTEARSIAERIADGILCDLPIDGPVRSLLMVRMDVAFASALLAAEAAAVEAK